MASTHTYSGLDTTMVNDGGISREMTFEWAEKIVGLENENVALRAELDELRNHGSRWYAGRLMDTWAERDEAVAEAAALRDALAALYDSSDRIHQAVDFWYLDDAEIETWDNALAVAGRVLGREST